MSTRAEPHTGSRERGLARVVAVAAGALVVGVAAGVVLDLLIGDAVGRSSLWVGVTVAVVVLALAAAFLGARADRVEAARRRWFLRELREEGERVRRAERRARELAAREGEERRRHGS